MKIELSEDERHALAHADWAVSHATPDKPDVCFDYTLVRTLTGLTKRLRIEAEDSRDDARRMHQEKMTFFEDALILKLALKETTDRLAKLVNNTGGPEWKDNPDGWAEAQQQVLKNSATLGAPH